MEQDESDKKRLNNFNIATLIAKGCNDKDLENYGYTKQSIEEAKKANNINIIQEKTIVDKKEILLPFNGKLITDFAEEVSEILKDKNTIFYRPDLREIVEIDNNEFNIVNPSRFITLLEKYATPSCWKLKEDIKKGEKKDYELTPKSMNENLSKTLLQSHILRNRLPKIQRIFNCPIPIIYNGELTFPNKGYDKRFNSWLPYNSPTISYPNMNLEDAKDVLATIFEEFCFKSEQDYTNAVAGLITPFLKGLYPRFNNRSPLFVYLANRERSGKDYLAGITGILYEGYALEESPICNGERGNNNDELRKKILSALISGKKRLHFANNKGHLDNSVLEGVITAERHSDRILGRNELADIDNELDFSMSGNIGISFTPDLMNRSRFINLFLEIEDANSRKFANPYLHEWLKDNRELILSALYSLVRNWIEKGKPIGSICFASFPIWANICGGIMECAGYANPCNPDKEVLALGGDSETNEMKQLYEYLYEKRPEEFIDKYEIRNIISVDDLDIFSYFDFSKKTDQTKFGLKLSKFNGRILSGIRMISDNNPRPARRKFKFTKKLEEEQIKVFNVRLTSKKDGNLGNLGNLCMSEKLTENNNTKIYMGMQMDTIVAKDTKQ